MTRTTPTWQAERRVDGPLVRRLLEQFPELEPASVELLSEGWDRSVWLVDRELVFGFPRREVAVAGLEREIAVLPRLAPLLPLAIPAPAFVGRPSDEFPWPFSGGPFLPGVEAGEAGLGDDARTSVGVGLAAFLRRLHAPGPAAAVDADELPVDPNGRADMRRRVPMAREALAELERLGLWRNRPGTAAILGEAEELPPPSGAATVAHGDLHFRHLLVDDGGASGVVDWIDVCLADPAIDLQLLWSFLPPAGRGPFVAAYGAISGDQLLRARVLALGLSAQLALYGHAEGRATIAREALAGLDRTLVD